MAEDITPPADYVAGESINYEFTVTDPDTGNAKDITGASVDWWLLPEQGAATSTAELSTADSGVSVALTTDGSDGRVDLTIDQGVTDGLSGGFWQLLHVDDLGDGLQKYRGNWYIEQP